MSNQETPETPPQPAQDATQAPTPQQPDPRQGQRPSRPLKDTKTPYGNKLGRPRKDGPPAKGPKTPEAKTPQDPSQPLENAEHERYATLLVSGLPQVTAYQQARGGRIPYNSAKVTASEWTRRPYIAARVDWLRTDHAKRILEAKTTAQPLTSDNQVKTPRKPAPETKSQPITRDEVIDKLSTAIRGGDAQTVVAGIKALQAIMPELSVEPDNRPDPCAVIDYLTTFAARPGVEIVAEFGGMPFILRRLRDTLRCDYADIRLGLEQVSRSTPKTQESQQTPTKTPDTQSGAAPDAQA